MKRLLVFGRAQGVWDEVSAAQQLCSFDGVIGVGSTAMAYPGPLTALVSFHAELFTFWAEQRAKQGFPPAEAYVSSMYKGGTTRRGQNPKFRVQFVSCDGGSSGLIAAVAAVELFKANQVVLAGIPMVASRGQVDTGAVWREAMMHRLGWQNNLARIKDHVRSMSGWTQELLGAPTPDWLGVTRAAA
jgi:hypothetical protein